MATERPAYDKKSIPLCTKLGNMEKINAIDIMRRLIAEGKMPSKDLARMMTVVNKFMGGVKEEIVWGRKVKIRNVWNFYPAKLPDRKTYHCPANGKMIPAHNWSIVMRFVQNRTMKEYFRANFKWIKWKTPK